MVMSLSILVSGIIFYMSQMVNAVYIRDGQNAILAFTAKRDVAQILEDNEISIMTTDVIKFSGFSGKAGEINIKRAYPVNIMVDGRNYTTMFAGDTVGELLENQKITLGEYDIISHPKGTFLNSGDSLVINRVKYETFSVVESIPYKTEYKKNSLLKTGKTRVLVAGSSGSRTLTYTKRLVDGREEETRLVNTVTTKSPVGALVLVGGSEPVSPLNFSVETDVQGRPLHYARKLESQISTGYSAGPRAWGASGMNLSAGYVAVRASDIPYGTKLYITSADGSFVYGYAIAADTGTGLMLGHIDVDLFYDTYIESCLNGRKLLDIYVLG